MKWRASPHRFQKRGKFSPPRNGDVLVTTTVGAHGHAFALWAAPGEAAALHGRTINDGGASFANTALAEPVEVRVTQHTSSGSTEAVSVFELGLAFPRIQPMPQGELLVVGARCRWTPEGGEPNAVLYAADGSPRRTAVVGDGVEHVRATAAGAVWIGYSDEGVYGNFGWGMPGPEPIGRSGLARFDTDLNLVWEFPLDEATPRIDDCYALNVQTDVWACYYSDFPIVHITGDSVRVWQQTDPQPVTTLLIDQDRVALVGKAITIAEIDGDDLRVTGSFPLALPQEAGARGTQFIGQGPILHVLTPDGTWYLADLDTLRR